MPLGYETCDGFKLGRWVNVKRTTKSNCKLDKQQIASLNDLGFVWDVHDHLWEQGIARLRQYKAEHGHVLVPWGFETCDGFNLGHWVSRKRTTKSKGKLAKQQIASLDDLGFVWDVYGHLWEQGITRLRQYKTEHGHVLVPCDCETSDGFKVGTWVARKHDACSKGTLKWEQVQCLEELGFRLINNLLTRRREYVQCMHWAAQVLERDKRHRSMPVCESRVHMWPCIRRNQSYMTSFNNWSLQY